MDVKGATALVTGGGSGMGEATARALAAAGATVAVLDANRQAAEQVAAQIGGRAYACDVADGESAEAAVAEARDDLGVARIVVNCAGIAPGARLIGRDGPHRLDLFERVIAVNLIGTFNIMRLTAAAMMAMDLPPRVDERGVIVNTASIAAFEGQVGQLAYSASKGGVVAMTLPAARELARSGIRVMAIAPGLIATPMLSTMPPEVQASLAASTLFPHRLGRPDEFAQLVLHICRNEMLNGEVIRLDGALRLPPR